MARIYSFHALCTQYQTLAWSFFKMVVLVSGFLLQQCVPFGFETIVESTILILLGIKQYFCEEFDFL